ncbi:MAG: hypothetical protein RMJ07_05975 [Nitrososphaerota archaeon]|nr:hypothetical protein [Candidatus Bathyarchaeota archaeon]MDW8049206.1 hypothetical protein [Nitrososphaerota archaeon]
MIKIFSTMRVFPFRVVEDFESVWKEVMRFKDLNKSGKSPEFLGIQKDGGSMILLSVYDEEKWVWEEINEGWGEDFGKIDLARDFEVKEMFLTDEELKEELKRFLIRD